MKLFVIFVAVLLLWYFFLTFVDVFFTTAVDTGMTVGEAIGSGL
jgi:hypothetical protein